jgi:SAM-dependent methyltransferase
MVRAWYKSAVGSWTAFVSRISRHFRLRRSLLYREFGGDLRAKSVCDLGGSRHFWESMPADVVPGDLTLLNISDDGQSRSHSGRFSNLDIQLYDGQNIPFPDSHFDIVICNSVLEHVPPAQRAPLCAEIRRVGRYHFVQTPAYAFPIEPHFVAPAIHWLPRPVGRHLVRFGLWSLLSRPGRARRESYFDEVQLLTRREVAALFPGSAIVSERLAGLPKSYTAHGPGSRVSVVAA